MSIVEGEYADLPERDIIQAMRLSYPFKDFSMDVIRRTAKAGIPIRYESGDIIIRQGEEGDSIFLVICGYIQLFTELDDSATLQAKGNQFLLLTKGDTFGAHSLVWDEEESNLWKSYHVREFYATAEEFSIVVEFSRQAMLPVLYSSITSLLELTRR